MTTRVRSTKFQVPYCIILMVVWLAFSPAIQADLVAYWPLDGQLKDAAPFGQINDDGQFVGQVTFKDGRIGQGIVLDGSNHVSIPTSPDLEAGNKNISISAWFRVDAWPERYETLLAKGSGNNYQLARHAVDPDRLAYFGGIQGDPLKLRPEGQ